MLRASGAWALQEGYETRHREPSKHGWHGAAVGAQNCLQSDLWPLGSERANHAAAERLVVLLTQSESPPVRAENVRINILELSTRLISRLSMTRFVPNDF